MHCVRLKITEYKENDNLYNIFALYSEQDCDFIRRWLEFFMMMVYPKNFECAGYHCLTAKGLTLDTWSDSIEDGWKGDFLSLYGLNLMLDTHTAIHLSNNRLWTTIKNPPKNHDMLLPMCNFHLVYLGRGLFVELIERKHPLIVVEKTADVKTVLIGELIFDESEALDKVINHGFGVGVDKHSTPSCTTSQRADSEMVNIILIKEETVTDSESTTPLHKDETNLEKEYNLKTLEIRCNHLDVVKYLLSRDKNTHATNSTVSTPDEKSYVSTICNKLVRINLHKLDLKNARSIKLIMTQTKQKIIGQWQRTTQPNSKQY